MFQRYTPQQSLAGIDISSYAIEQLKNLVAALLERKIHGICFSHTSPGKGRALS